MSGRMISRRVAIRTICGRVAIRVSRSGAGARSRIPSSLPYHDTVRLRGQAGCISLSDRLIGLSQNHRWSRLHLETK